MNKQMGSYVGGRNTTAASVTAKYCEGCQESDIGAVSSPVTTRLLPVDVTVTAASATIHPGECVSLAVTVCNRSELILTCPKLQLNSCNGIKICELPQLEEIQPGQSFDCQVICKAENYAPSRCEVKICLLFCADGCRCKACSEAILFTVSRVMPGIKIDKVTEPGCCITPGTQVKVCLTICNTGTIALKELCITDELPHGMIYRANSTSIGGLGCFDADPERGISIACLKAGETVKVCYCMVMKGESCGC